MEESQHRNYVGGQWVPADGGRTLTSLNPADHDDVLGTFPASAAEDVAKAVEDGKISFAVDQQPYLQGYLSVVMLTQYKANLNVLGGGQPVLTGPNLITKANAAAVIKLAAGGTR